MVYYCNSTIDVYLITLFAPFGYVTMAARVKRATAMGAALKIRRHIRHDNCLTSSSVRKVRVQNKSAKRRDLVENGCERYKRVLTTVSPDRMLSKLLRTRCNHVQCFNLLLQRGCRLGPATPEDMHILIVQPRGIITALWQHHSPEEREYADFGARMLNMLLPSFVTERLPLARFVLKNGMHLANSDNKELDGLRIDCIRAAVNTWEPKLIELFRANIAIPEPARLDMIATLLRRYDVPLSALVALGPFNYPDLIAHNPNAIIRAFDAAKLSLDYVLYLYDMGFSVPAGEMDTFFLSALFFGNAPLALHWIKLGANIAAAHNHEAWTHSNSKNLQVCGERYLTGAFPERFLPGRAACFDLALQWKVPMLGDYTKASFCEGRPFRSSRPVFPIH